MDWNNIDLDSQEVELKILEEIKFKELLTFANANLKDVNKENVINLLTDLLKDYHKEAIEMLEANADNIVKKINDDRLFTKLE